MKCYWAVINSHEDYYGSCLFLAPTQAASNLNMLSLAHILCIVGAVCQPSKGR